MDSAAEMRVDAELCLVGGGLGAARNRLYYACFRAAQAGLVSVGVEPPKTHKGTKMLFRRHLVDTGRVDESVGATLDRMEEYRLLGDYSEASATKDEVLAALHHVDVFLDTIRTELVPGYEVSEVIALPHMRCTRNPPQTTPGPARGCCGRISCCSLQIGYYVGKSPGTDTTRRGSKSGLSSRS